MPTDKEVKLELRKKASEEPEKYYAVEVLRQEGFSRKQCGKCSRHFWSVTDSKVCGDPACSGGFRFFGTTPAKNRLDYIEVWKKFAGHFKKLGYEPIRRYPVAARWRDDTDFVQASIYDFQPYVVSGEVEPPANPLVVPQFSLRFNDIDNVGITGAHFTGFVMIGQHAFMPPEKWDKDRYFSDIHSWLMKGIGLAKEEVSYHEDAWAGGGNSGPCMEYFSRGLELGNQVYMTYENTPAGLKELKLKVLDMGMGQERNAWFTTAKSTSYEAVMPTVCEMLLKQTGAENDTELVKKFIPYSSYLNIDEVENIDKSWKEVAKQVGVSAEGLKGKIMPLAAVYSIAEHTRSLLVALSDGVLPSNAGGGYNLRVLLRRALGLADKYSWKVDLYRIAEEHAKYLKPQYPELLDNLEDVKEILEVEERKYRNTLTRATGLVEAAIRKGQLDEKKLIEMYDSQGVNPEIIAEEAARQNRKVKVPDNFYALVSARHEKKEKQAKQQEKTEFAGVKETKALYYQDYRKTAFESKVAGVKGKHVALESTYFYPTSGGQEHDTGKINGEKVASVEKQGNIIVHVMQENPKFKAGDQARCEIDWLRRKQLTQHHTATHIINGILRKKLGNHAWQAGAAKFPDKARLDITHYEPLTDGQLKEIEAEANRMVHAGKEVKKYFLPRAEAEKKFGFALYQGGAVPGKQLRIVEVNGLDVECCGGTHLDNTSEAEQIRILRSSKIQDGVVRLEFAAGEAARKLYTGDQDTVNELAAVLECEPGQIPARAEELFSKWKDKVKKGKHVDAKLTAAATYDGDVLAKASEIFRTQKEHLVKTAKRFRDELEN